MLIWTCWGINYHPRHFSYKNWQRNHAIKIRLERPNIQHNHWTQPLRKKWQVSTTTSGKWLLKAGGVSQNEPHKPTKLKTTQTMSFWVRINKQERKEREKRKRQLVRCSLHFWFASEIAKRVPAISARLSPWWQSHVRTNGSICFQPCTYILVQGTMRKLGMWLASYLWPLIKGRSLSSLSLEHHGGCTA